MFISSKDKINHLSVSISESLGYPLLEGAEVLLAAQTDRGDGLLHHGAVSEGEEAAGHALLGWGQ